MRLRGRTMWRTPWRKRSNNMITRTRRNDEVEENNGAEEENNGVEEENNLGEEQQYNGKENHEVEGNQLPQLRELPRFGLGLSKQMMPMPRRH
ncbi:hypothetical protein CDL15_Pgr002469 [Punica granatum]|uniref:Uncharacterized protein n=1 Tax=Punica granatum TaxID=22663 RepID=A0A218XWP2_PUNGR|nr:hypothetical protein CDL15_Pgr002469 [Punica granatum]PKI65664.1 hypothetical protein CRG98_013959 [Punica granatum]